MRGWWARRALERLRDAAREASLAYDAAVLIRRTDGTYVVPERAHQRDRTGAVCGKCALPFPCPMARLTDAVHQADKGF